MVITKIVGVKDTCCDLYVDGVQRLTLDAEVIYSQHLKPGLEISPAYLEQLLAQSDFLRAKEKALGWLSIRDYSSKELRERLSVFFDIQTAEAVVRKMRQIGLIADEKYAEKYARDLLERRGLSLSRARFELRQKGLDEELTEQAVAPYLDSEPQRIAAIVEKKYYSKLRQENGYRKVVAALARMGFSLGDIREVVKQYAYDNPEEDIMDSIGE